MLIECPHCQSRVNGTIKGESKVHDDGGYGIKEVLVECPACEASLLGSCERYPSDYDGNDGSYIYSWSALKRLWPEGEDGPGWEIPEIASISLDEAKRCFRGQCYSAAAVMCGRAIEGVCKHHRTSTKNLADGLKHLKTEGIIDARLYEWGEALRKHRNLGAHASTERVTKEDAQDLVDFAFAICEYVFVLNAKFEKFKQRQTKT